MNTNRVEVEGFSNPTAGRLYTAGWPDEPALNAQYRRGEQCGGCSFFAPFNFDWGLCCHAESRHHLETVFEHFTCPSYVEEGWGPHSFSKSLRCTCAGTDRDPGPPVP